MSRHKCTKELYKAFLQASSVRYSGLALSEVAPNAISHDSISRWIQAIDYRPREIWYHAEKHIDKEERCFIVGDDTVMEKQRSQEIDLVHYQYSGNAHDVIAGIGLVNLVWYGQESESYVPVDYRVYDKDTDGKTKNEHFREMLKLAKSRGINPEAVVMDAWYSSLGNLKTISNFGWIFVTGLKKNRKVNRNATLEELTIPDEGLKVHLRGYGWVTVYRFEAKNGRTDYLATNKESSTREQIEEIWKARWSIEVYHRELKQTCGLERCQSRTGRAQRNHIGLAITAWLEQHKIRCSQKITLYQQKWEVIKESISMNIARLMAVP